MMACYQIVVDILKSDRKAYLYIDLMAEIASVQTQFNFHHYAANTYEEAITYIIEQKLQHCPIFTKISNSKKRLMEPRILKAQLFLFMFKHDDCRQFCNENFTNDMKILFQKMCDDAIHNRFSEQLKIIRSTRAMPYFTEQYLQIFSKQYQLLNQHVASAYSILNPSQPHPWLI
jgi:hypothetical protein